MENNMEKLIKNQIQDLGITEELISMIVKDVLEKMNVDEPNDSQLIKESDDSGLKVVRGDSIVFEKFDTGKPEDKVTYKEILSIKECPNMATGFLDIDNSSFDWFLGYDELDYVIEGTLEITINGKKYTARPGDVMFIPMNSAVTFSSPDRCRVFFSTYPANWQDLCEEK